MEQNKKILVFGLVGLGDMIQFSPCLKILREGFSNSQIIMFTNRDAVGALFKKSPYLDEVIYFDFLKAKIFEKIRFMRSLRRRHFDISILPFPSYRREFNIASRIVGATSRYSFKFSKGNLRELSFLNNCRIDADPALHNVENDLKLMRELGLRTTGDEKYELPVQPSTSFVDSFLRERNINPSDLKIGVHPGTDTRGKDRRLDVYKFAEISGYLADKYNAKVFVFLGPHEENLKNEFLSSVGKHRPVIVENMEIEKVAQLISTCNIFISSDSGLMHIASAMGVPTIAIFGPTNPVFVRPWGVRHEIVRLGLECSPCFVFTEKHPLNAPLIECKIDEKFACMRRIESEDVLVKVEKMIRLLYGL
jgi:ADP-heptose:LPS heptosyltransferase